jgi:sigma-E factor negative regulatory protein RseA
MDKMQMQEMISALADGQLQGEACERVIHAVASDPQARNAWHTYHLIGDVLRTGHLPTGTAPAKFLAGFQVRLERAQPAAPEVAVPQPLPVAQLRFQAANDGSFRWKMVAGFASLAAVGAIGWSVAGDLLRPPAAQLAAAPASGVVAMAERPPVMMRDPRLDEMLAAHRQLGVGASALQIPGGFLRNATFEGSGR